MKRQISGLHAADRSAPNQIPDGVFLVRVQRVRFQRQAQKPYYTLTLTVLEPSRFAGQVVSSRLYCTPEGPVEAELVPARLRLRHRIAGTRRGRREATGRT